MVQAARIKEEDFKSRWNAGPIVSSELKDIWLYRCYNKIKNQMEYNMLTACRPAGVNRFSGFAPHDSNSERERELCRGLRGGQNARTEVEKALASWNRSNDPKIIRVPTAVRERLSLAVSYSAFKHVGGFNIDSFRVIVFVQQSHYQTCQCSGAFVSLSTPFAITFHPLWNTWPPHSTFHSLISSHSCHELSSDLRFSV